MATKTSKVKQKTYRVCREYKVMMASDIVANSLLEAAGRLDTMMYKDFVEEDSSESTHNEMIFLNE